MKSQNIQKLFCLLFSALIFSAFSSPAAAPAHGKQRLRELAVFPSVDLNFDFTWNFNGSLWQVGSTADLKEDIAELQGDIKNHPEDIQALLKLGYFYSLNHQGDEAKAHFEKAESLCRDRLINRPKDGLLLTQFAKALDELGKETEAESAYRQAVLLSSNEWRTWAGLSAFLEGRAYGKLMPADLHKMLTPFAKPPQKVLDYQPPEDALKEVKSIAQEAAQCAARAMSLITNEPDAFMDHAGFAQSSAMVDFWLRYFQPEKFWDQVAWRAAFPCQGTVDAVKKAADLKPKDSRLMGTAVYMSWSSWFLGAGSKEYDPAQMPEAVSRAIHEGMTRLEALSRDSDNRTAANALVTLATLKILMKGSPADAADLARKATRLDPTQEQAWDLWLVCSMMDNAPADRLVMICESRLKQKNSARNHLLFAKALTRDSKWSEADSQTHAAILLEPTNVIAQLMKIALILRESTDDPSLNRSLGLFELYKQYLRTTPASPERRARWREGWLDYAIFMGLYAGEDHQKDALNMAAEVLKNFPDDDDAKKIHEALE